MPWKLDSSKRYRILRAFIRGRRTLPAGLYAKSRNPSRRTRIPGYTQRWEVRRDGTTSALASNAAESSIPFPEGSFLAFDPPFGQVGREGRTAGEGYHATALGSGLRSTLERGRQDFLPRSFLSNRNLRGLGRIQESSFNQHVERPRCGT